MLPLVSDAIACLQQLIAVPSFSREEQATAAIIHQFLTEKGIETHQLGHNIWAKNRHFDPHKPIILLNSHHDTVKPVKGWTRDPFAPDVVEGKLYGLGSNDAGASLVALMATFQHFYARTDLAYNLVLAASAEEEISGANGIAALLAHWNFAPSVGIVGEPTLGQMAVAEKGLMVIDAVAHGQAGHAARNEGLNAIYVAMTDIDRIRHFKWPKTSPFLGDVKMTVTQIEAGTQHNVVPDACRYVIDVRSTDSYSNQEIHQILAATLSSTLSPRSYRLNSSRIDLNHPLVQRGLALGLSYYGSPTLSDQALMPFETLKIGVGDSARSHTADEFVFIEEIEQGIARYIQLLEGLVL